jgi:hypothetical protein
MGIPSHTLFPVCSRLPSYSNSPSKVLESMRIFDAQLGLGSFLNGTNRPLENESAVEKNSNRGAAAIHARARTDRLKIEELFAPATPRDIPLSEGQHV